MYELNADQAARVDDFIADGSDPCSCERCGIELSMTEVADGDAHCDACQEFMADAYARLEARLDRIVGHTLVAPVTFLL